MAAGVLNQTMGFLKGGPSWVSTRPKDNKTDMTPDIRDIPGGSAKVVKNEIPTKGDVVLHSKTPEGKGFWMEGVEVNGYYLPAVSSCRFGSEGMPRGRMEITFVPTSVRIAWASQEEWDALGDKDEEPEPDDKPVISGGHYL